jgi:predicted DNA-binding transcriptional regulator YafY
MDDLIEACNEELAEFSPNTDGIKKRQIFEDIKFMESEQGWSIPLDRLKDGKKVYYRYSNKNFTIKNKIVSNEEALKLRESITILSRFKGMPQFEFMEEMVIRLESSFDLKEIGKPIVGFEQNKYLKGITFFSDLFNAIQFKQVLQVNYQSFRQKQATKVILHPYFLKEYNSRWFLFGYNEELKRISNMALDRIVEFKEVNKKYIENENIDFNTYFEDIIGVTNHDDETPVKILLQINKELWPYIETKPIHESQTPKKKDGDFKVIQLELKINYELIALIFSLGEHVKVLEPKALVDSIKSKAQLFYNNYFKND